MDRPVDDECVLGEVGTERSVPVLLEHGFGRRPDRRIRVPVIRPVDP